MIAALALPSSAQALRPMQAGAEENPSVNKELKQELQQKEEDPIEAMFRRALSSLGNVPTRGSPDTYPDILNEAIDAFLRASSTRRIADAFEDAVESLGYDGVALYLVNPPARPGDPFVIRSEFRNSGGFVRPSAASGPVPAAFEKDWALRKGAPRGELYLHDRWRVLRGTHGDRIDRNALESDAQDYGGREKVAEAYYLVLENQGKPWALVLIQNWKSGRPLFEGGMRRRRQVREMVETLGNAAGLALENVRSLGYARRLGVLLKAVHDLKNSVQGVSSSVELLEMKLERTDLDAGLRTDLTGIGAEIQSLSSGIRKEAQDILRGFQGAFFPADSSPRSSLRGLAGFNRPLHDLAVELWRPVLRGDLEGLRDRIGRVNEAARARYGAEPEKLRKISAVLNRWETLASLAVAARNKPQEAAEDFAPQLLRLVQGARELAAFDAPLEERAKQYRAQPDLLRSVEGVRRQLSALSEAIGKFTKDFGTLLGLNPDELKPGPRNLVSELSNVVYSSLPGLNQTVTYGGLKTADGRPLENLRVDWPTAWAASSALRELLHNAWKYRRDREEIPKELRGQLKVSVAAKLDSESGRLSVTVTDNGVGIPESRRNRLFSMGERLERGSIEGTEGTGYGLAPQREALGVLGGDLELVSSRAVEDVKAGQPTGSTFRLVLPVKPLPAAAPMIPAVSSKPAPPGQSAAGMEETVWVGALEIPRGGLEMDGLTVQGTGQEAAGLESYLQPGGRALVVPADQPGILALALSPGIRQVQPSVAAAGIEVRRLPDPATAREALRREPVSLLLLTPEDAARGDWRGGSGVPTVILPAAAAAGLEQRDLAVLAAAARARGGMLEINGLTWAGAAEQGSLVVLQMS